MKKIINFIAIILIAVAIWVYMKHRHVSKTSVSTDKVLTTAVIANIKTLDPIQGSDSYSVHEITKVYEGLVEYHYLKRPFELAPNLAESMPTISDDRLIYTFKIKKGVLFQDSPCFPNGKGREVTAEDFVYSFKRLADPRMRAAGFWTIDGKIKGVNEWKSKYMDAAVTDYTEPIEGLKVLDKYTLQITLNNPFPQFLYVLSMAYLSVVPVEAVSHYKEEFANHPVGTGPFMLKEFNPQDTKITYYKNPTFRDKYFPNEAAEEYKDMLVYAGRKLPLVDKVVTHILPESQPRWLKFKTGGLDIIDVTKDKLAKEIIQNNKLISGLQEKGIDLFQAPEVVTSYVVINNAHTLFKDNLKLRQALSLAFDGEGYNKLFYNGKNILAQSTIAPTLAGYAADYVNPYRVYNIEKAKKYLAEAGYPAGKGLPEITLDASNTTDLKQKAEFFQNCMAKIGVRIKIVENIFPTLLKKISTNETMLHMISWSADYPDAETFLQLLYGPAEGGIGINYNDPVYNALYEKASTMPDSPARTEIYKEMNKLAAENVPAIYVEHPTHTVLQHGWVKNFCWSDFHYGSEQYFDIDLEQKKLLSSKL